MAIALDRPAVHSYRLLGYENRVAGAQLDAAIDAGAFGGGYTLSALYEVDIRGGERLGQVQARATALGSGPGLVAALEIGKADIHPTLAAASADFRFAAAAAAVADQLREHPALGFSLAAA